jgi:predicted TIM-barrel fold metal-dependent hydrolase
VTGPDHVVFGSDYPYPLDRISIGGLRQLQQTSELDDDERASLFASAAAQLLPSLRNRP